MSNHAGKGDGIVFNGDNAAYLIETADRANRMIAEQLKGDKSESDKFSYYVEKWMSAILGEMQLDIHTDYNKAVTELKIRNDLVDAGIVPTLKGLHCVQDFKNFMESCLMNSEFSDNIENALNKIPDFSLHTGEIVDNLVLLNDHAIEIYKKHKGNEKDAMKELASKALDCSGDPKHKDKLKFPFSYELEQDGEKVLIGRIGGHPY